MQSIQPVQKKSTVCKGRSTTVFKLADEMAVFKAKVGLGDNE